jgi:hypothetical protein
MTRLEELEMAYEAKVAAAVAAAVAVNAAWDAYEAELKKTQEENSDEYDQVQEGDGSTV